VQGEVRVVVLFDREEGLGVTVRVEAEGGEQGEEETTEEETIETAETARQYDWDSADAKLSLALLLACLLIGVLFICCYFYQGRKPNSKIHVEDQQNQKGKEHTQRPLANASGTERKVLQNNFTMTEENMLR